MPSQSARIGSPDPAVLAAYGLAHASVEPCTHGLINRTWLLRDGTGHRSVLQAVNPMFPHAIHDDIEVVTRHLQARGLTTPRLIRTASGALFTEVAGQAWRLLTYIEGVSHEVTTSPGEATQAGTLLARFHLTLADLAHEFKNARLGVHDTARHLARLEAALETHTAHRHYAAAAPLARRVLGAAAALPALPPAPDRIVHGDPKISNIVFDPDSGAALCLIDLDTLSRMPLALELGDACRSWCNPRPEDAAEAEFSLPLFAAAVSGYANVARDWLMPAEWQSIGTATATITLELAARFCADALNERYFAWDSQRYASASEHNLARTRSQLALAESLLAQRGALERALATAFEP